MRTDSAFSAGLLVCASLLGTPAPGHAQAAPTMPDSVAAYLDSALAIMEEHVIGSDTVDWVAFRARVHEAAAGSEIPLDTYRAIRRALRELNPHSFLQTGPERREEEVARHPELASAPTSQDREERPVHSPFSEGRNPEGRLFDQGGRRFGYVRVPAFGGDHLATFADSIQSLVRDQDAAGACGWIVDLRGNGGGNMWPMLAGLGPLLGEGKLGEFRSADGVDGTWFHEAGVTGIIPGDGRSRVEIARVSEPWDLDGHPPVAVLVDGGTASSGEAVAIAFIHRPLTRSFGVPSYGFTTANEGFRLPDGANMVLTVGVNADRTGRPYTEALVPDDTVSIRTDGVIPATPPEADQDRQLQAALRWISTNAVCGT